MSDTISAVIVCGGCNKKFAWKPELAGKRVKCKCGQAISVAGGQRSAAKPVIPVQKSIPKKPAAPLPAAEPGGLDDLYALAEDADRAAAAMPVDVADYAPVADTPPAKKSKRSGTATAIPLAYAGPPGARQRKKEAEAAAALTEPNRDLYAPLAILSGGIIAYMSYFIVAFHLPSASIPVVGVGVVFLMLFKTVLLVGFALVTAGPLGVSFGSLWSAVLKLAAIAVFADGITVWIDHLVSKGSGGFGGKIIGWPVAIGMYWVLLIYLFGMDPGESRLVVVCLALFDRAVKFVIVMLLLNVILGWGGVSAPPLSGVAGSKSAAHTSELGMRVDELKDRDALIEARKYCAAGHQSVVLKSTNEWYAAGCPNVWFEMSGRDINGHRTEQGMLVELPQDKVKRAKCYNILAGYYKDIGRRFVDPAELKDTGEDYVEMDLH